MSATTEAHVAYLQWWTICATQPGCCTPRLEADHWTLSDSTVTHTHSMLVSTCEKCNTYMTSRSRLTPCPKWNRPL